MTQPLEFCGGEVKLCDAPSSILQLCSTDQSQVVLTVVNSVVRPKKKKKVNSGGMESHNVQKGGCY